MHYSCIDLRTGNTHCVTTDCPQPQNPPNTIVLSGIHEVSTRRILECTTGYAILGSQGSIVCQASRNWTFWTGECAACSEPSPIDNASVGPGSVTVGSKRTYTCNSGYSSNGQQGTITCGNDASWSSTTFTCIKGTNTGRGEIRLKYSKRSDPTQIQEEIRSDSNTGRYCSGTIRLSNGLLEVCYDNTWGTVCDDGFTNDNAVVACRRLGYGTGTMNTHGGGSGTIWMDNVVCVGSESSLFQCSHNGWGVHNCAHSEDVGLICS